MAKLPAAHLLTKYTFSTMINRGDCCAMGSTFQIHMNTGTGACCPPGTTFTGSACSAGGGDPNVVEPGANDPTYGNLVSTERKICQQNCNNLGLKYGHCYRMTNSNGQALNRFPQCVQWVRCRIYRTKGKYYEDGIYRSATLNLTATEQKFLLLARDEFLLNDYKGAPGTANRRGYIGQTSSGKMAYLDETFYYSTVDQKFMSSSIYGLHKVPWQTISLWP